MRASDEDRYIPREYITCWYDFVGGTMTSGLELPLLVSQLSIVVDNVNFATPRTTIVRKQKRRVL